jgi:hypothetical protein
MAVRQDVSHDRKIELAEMAKGLATLNGSPALIMGGLKNEDFARVWHVKHCYEVEFSWSAVERILTTKGGAFITYSV